VIVGQKDMVQKLLVALLADGHILLEGMPGLAKTLAIKTLSDRRCTWASAASSSPGPAACGPYRHHDLQPAQRGVQREKGPIFSNFILADEINRAPAKVQSALLEAMQERQVTIGTQTFKLPEPFLVLATMNPIEQEGTYPLPEAQTDRFMLKVVLDYPRKEEEKLIIRQNTRVVRSNVQKVITPADIVAARKLVREVYMDEKIEQYIVDIVRCHAQAGPIQAGRPQLVDRFRRLAARQHQHGPGCQGLRLHQAPRIRDPGGCARRVPGRAAAPHRAHL
jgi:MoxR-like ATPase